MSDRPSTALQRSLAAVFAALDGARAELGRREYEVLLDVLAARLARDYLVHAGLLMTSTGHPDDEAAA